jgi:alkylmercury lyase
MTPGLATAEIADHLGCCTEELDPADQRTQLTLFRLLAAGKPVELAQLARAAGLEAPDVAARLDRWHGVHADDAGRIVAFQGLSLVEAPHRMRVDGRTLYAWCAWDTLFLPELIGKPTDVESNCPSTGATVSLWVGPDGPADLAPAEAVMSFLLPWTRFREDTIASFCNFIHYFASPRAAAEWTAERPGTFVLSIEQAFEIGRHTNAAQWGEAIGRGGATEGPAR